MEAQPAGLKLWEITDELDAIAEQIAEAGGELTEETEAALERMEGALESKVERVALFIENAKETAAAAKRQEERLRAIRRHHESKVEGLSSYLQYELERSGRDKVETEKVRVRVQDNSRPSIRWTESLTMLPKRYLRVRKEVDTKTAYEVWKETGELPAGFVVEHGRHLRIY